MGDLATLAKARRELEELYLGVPDESVNLTFQDLADVKQNVKSPEKKKSTAMDPIPEAKTPKDGSPFKKLPSLDFNRALQASNNSNHRHHKLDHVVVEENILESSRGRSHHHHHHHLDLDGHRYVNEEKHRSGHASASEFRHAVEISSRAYDMDSSAMSAASTYQEERGGGRRRPGMPHSNICTICGTYIYIFRHRCLVCGRVYCRNCVTVGMGEMTEGRKCVECLGRRFSQRYIQRAGKVGCCSRYPRILKQAELKWAEKGPRKSAERPGYGRNGVMSRSRSPVTPRTPTRAHAANNSASFVVGSPYSPYTPSHHHMPF